MSPAAKRHMELERELAERRVLGDLTEFDMDRFLEEMGDLWWQMTDEERAEANKRAAEYNNGKAG